jgi:uncharacterized membrane protein YphA (DoxX/SURF4 family)
MSEIQETSTKRRPWHLWVVGLIALVWNSMGAMDYFMTQTKNEAYMGQFTPEQLEYFYGFPAWVVSAWAIAVWGGVLGALLLLLRKRHAVWVFLASFIAMVVTTIHNYGLSDGMKVMGDAFSLVFSAVIFLIALALLLYARALQKREILV